MAIPFDVLDRRFGKYLEFAYVVTTASGAATSCELAALVQRGSPSERRDELRQLLDRLPFEGRGVAAQVLLVILSGFLFYSVGRLARTMWAAAIWRLEVIAFWVRGTLRTRMGLYGEMLRIWEERHTRRRERSRYGPPRPSHLIRTPSFDLDALASELEYTLERSALRAIFDLHGLQFSDENVAGSLSKALPYAVTWLHRNGKGWSLATHGNAALLYDAATVPAVLAPATVGALTTVPTGGMIIEILFGVALGLVMRSSARRASVNARSSLLFEFVMNALVAKSDKEATGSPAASPDAPAQ